MPSADSVSRSVCFSLDVTFLPTRLCVFALWRTHQKPNRVPLSKARVAIRTQSSAARGSATTGDWAVAGRFGEGFQRKGAKAPSREEERTNAQILNGAVRDGSTVAVGPDCNLDSTVDATPVAVNVNFPHDTTLDAQLVGHDDWNRISISLRQLGIGSGHGLDDLDHDDEPHPTLAKIMRPTGSTKRPSSLADQARNFAMRIGIPPAEPVV